MARKSELEQLAQALVLARREMQDADARAKDIQARLIDLIPNKYLVDLGNGDSAQITKVAPTRYSWVASLVKEALPVRFWNRVRMDAVNRPILEAMIASGELSAFDLDPCKNMSETKPYLKITEKPRSADVVPLSRKGEVA